METNTNVLMFKTSFSPPEFQYCPYYSYTAQADHPDINYLGITKTRLLKYTEIFTTKKWQFFW